MTAGPEPAGGGTGPAVTDNPGRQRFEAPVVIVTKLKNRSWLSEPGPADPKNGTLPSSPAAL